MPDKKDEGHEPAKDAFELSDEDFRKEIDNAPAGPPEDDNIDSDADKLGGDAEKIEAKATPAEGDKKDKKEDPAPGGEDGATKAPPPADEAKPDGKKPDDKKPEGKAPTEDAGLVEIKHNGVVYKVTKEKYLELAQKGFDYDKKIGPHGRLVQLITSDPKIARLVHDHAVGATIDSQRSDEKTPPPESKKLKSLTEYESTEEWFRDNFDALSAAKPKPEQRTDPDPLVARDPQGLATLLFNHDPKHFKEVVPHLQEARRQLTVERSEEIEGSYLEFEKFYDEVKAKLVTGDATPPAPAPAASPTPPGDPSFRMKPGGGTPDRSTDQDAHVWDLSNKEFQEKLATVKGY